MPQENPQPEAEKEAAPVLTDELMADLVKNPTKLHEQPKEIQAAVRTRLTSDRQEPAKEPDPPQDPPVEDAPKEDAEAASKEEQKQEDEPKPLTAEQLEAKRKELKALADESNRLEQKLETARKRKEKADQAREEWLKANPEKNPDDYLDDGHQKNLMAQIRELTQKVEFLQTIVHDRDQEEIETLTRTKQTTEENRVQAEIESLQADDKFAAIRTKKPFAQLNREYAGWLDNLVQLSGLTQDGLSEKEKKDPVNSLRQKALEKYEQDAAFKESVKISPPDELDKLSLMLEAFHQKAQIGGTLKGHLFEILDKKGVLGQVVQRQRDEAARTAANKTVAAMKKDEITTMGPDDGRPPDPASSVEMTPQRAAALMAAIRKKQNEGVPLTQGDKDTIKKVAAYAGTLQSR